jgi:hypothetical protein
MSQGRKKNNESNADFDQVLAELEAQNDQLDRELESLARRAKLPKGFFENAEARLARYDGRLVKQAQEKVEAELATMPAPPPAKKKENRPSVFDLASQFKGRLLRV